MSKNESKNTFPEKFFEWMNDVSSRIEQTEKEIKSIEEHLRLIEQKRRVKDSI